MSLPVLWKSLLCANLLAASLACVTTACIAKTPNSPAHHRDPLAGADEQMLFEQGQAYAAVGDFIRAEQYLEASVTRGHSLQEALPLLIDVCVRSNRYGLALKHALPELARDPENWRLRYVVATLHAALGKDEEAETELRRVTMDAPEAAEAHFALARLLWDRSEHTESKSRFARYLELSPEGAHAVEARATLKRAAVGASPQTESATVGEETSTQEPKMTGPTLVEEAPE